jgi:hypothetical protein
MELFAYIGAALVALLVTVLPALAHKQHWNVIREDWRYPLRLMFGVLSEELGVVTVTYYCRGGNTVINGSLTGPTTSQAAQLVKQAAIVEFSVVGDIATALFTHNWGLDLSASQFGEPEILVEPISMATTAWPLFTFWRSGSNVVQINRPTTDLPTTILVTLRKPHSLGM